MRFGLLTMLRSVEVRPASAPGFLLRGIRPCDSFLDALNDSAHEEATMAVATKRKAKAKAKPKKAGAKKASSRAATKRTPAKRSR